MIKPADLVKALERNRRILEMQAADVTHEESLIQTDFNINCLNWTLGHIVNYRDDLLETLGGERVAPGRLDRYQRESDPVTADGPGVLDVSELVALVGETQDRLAAAIGGLTEGELTVEHTDGERSYTRAKQILFAYFHDTYHTGQTELLRQVAGKNDAVI